MERVQFQQEQMLAELKDFVDKGLFTQAEVKQIIKKRTAFETSLVRRVAKKGDFLRYASYEMSLEALRRKRAERSKSPHGVVSISDYALVRRQFHIFERALKKFKSDIGLWAQYIQVAKKEGARSLVGRITARAMKLHPNVPAFYILAASHELEHLSPSAARVLLQRGIRLNSDSVEMWKEYVKMELGFVEGLRRRWEVLGIKVDFKGKGKEAFVESNSGVESMEVDAMEEDTGESARREIMQGAIVKTVITNAAKAHPKADLFIALHDAVAKYPSPRVLRDSLLDHLHNLLRDTLPGDPRATKLVATRFLTSDLDVGSADFVDALQKANEKLAEGVREAQENEQGSEVERERRREDMAEAYVQFVDEWCQKDIDVNLKLYLLTSLRGLVRTSAGFGRSSAAPETPLLAGHILLAARLSKFTESAPAKILGLAREYAALPRVGARAKFWLARLEAERLVGETEEKIRMSWNEGRSRVRGDGMIDVWVWGLGTQDGERERATIKELLNESIRVQDSPSFTALHETLLDRYISVCYSPAAKGAGEEPAVLSLVRDIKRSFLASAHTWSGLFAMLTSESAVAGTAVTEVYRHWRELDAVESSIGYAGWLLGQGRAREGLEVIQSAQTEEAKEIVSQRWRELLSTHESGDLESENRCS